MTKKYIWAGALIIFVSILVSNLVTASTTDEEDESEYDSDTSVFTSITVEEYLELMENEERTYIYIGSESCSHCEDTVPVLKELMEDLSIEIMYLSVSDITSDELSQIKETSSIFDDGLGTPTMLVFEGGELTDYYIGEADYDTLYPIFVGEE